MILRAFLRNAQEIENSRELQIYGSMLASVHLLCAYWWGWGDNIARFTADPFRYCWPVWWECTKGPVFSESTVIGFFLAYEIIAGITLLLFLLGAKVRWAWVAMQILLLMKFVIFFQDFRAMGNYHTMAFITFIMYLYVPNKRANLRYMLVAFYIAAGMLKINSEWLSGKALPLAAHPRHWLLSGNVLQWACASVVFLEVYGVGYLLTSKTRIRWAVLACLGVFHAYSYFIVGYFYPSLMVLLLSIFPIEWVSERRCISSLIQPLVLGKAHLSTYIALAIFFAPQVYQRLAPGDTALHGGSRLLALNMIDARAQCESSLLVQQPATTLDVLRERDARMGIRIVCDPIVHVNYARRYCEMAEGSAAPIAVSVYLNSRRATDASFRRVLEIPNACDDSIQFSYLTSTKWILRSEAETEPPNHNESKFHDDRSI